MPQNVSYSHLCRNYDCSIFAADVCECLGDMTPEQSLVVLEMACYDDQFIDGNFHYSNHTDVEKIGLVLIANKTRYRSD